MKQDPDETSHWINEYRINAARMRAIANSVRRPEERAEFERLAGELEKFADATDATKKG